MPIPFSCDACGYSAEANDTYAGRSVKCPKCKELLTVPGESPTPQAARTMSYDSEVDWPAQIERFANKLDKMDARLAASEKYGKATAQYTGCLVIVFVVIPILFFVLVLLMGLGGPS